MLTQNNDDGNWGVGLIVIAAIMLLIDGGLHSGLGAIGLILGIIGFFKWFWFS